MTSGLEPNGHIVGCSLASGSRRTGFLLDAQTGDDPLITGRWSSAAGPDGARLIVVPDGAVEIVFAVDRPALVFGPQTRWITVELEPGAHRVGLRLRRGAAAAVLRVAADTLACRVIELNDLGCVSSDCSAPAEVQADHVQRLIQPAVHGLDFAVLNQVDALVEGRRRPFDDVSMGDRQARRRFRRAVGLPARTLIRILRVQRVLEGAAVHSELALSQLAHQYGFADQAHLCREVGAMTGRSPSALLERSSFAATKRQSMLQRRG